MAKTVHLRRRAGSGRRDLNRLASEALHQVRERCDPDAFDDAAAHLVFATCVIAARGHGPARIRHLLDALAALDLEP